jgi:uncharacterized protein (TIGR02217 family)
MPPFDDILFPLSISNGSSGGPVYRTFTARTAAGVEQRSTLNGRSLRSYNAALGVRSVADLYMVLQFFEARQGKLRGFRWRDWLDNSSSAVAQTAPQPTDQPLGVGNGTQTRFLLQKVYNSGTASTVRFIQKPVAGSVVVAVNGVLMAANTYSVNYSDGSITFNTPPSVNTILTAGFNFDVPARFDTDSLDFNMTSFQTGTLNQIPIIEVNLL